MFYFELIFFLLSFLLADYCCLIIVVLWVSIQFINAWWTCFLRYLHYNSHLLLLRSVIAPIPCGFFLWSCEMVVIKALFLLMAVISTVLKLCNVLIINRKSHLCQASRVSLKFDNWIFFPFRVKSPIFNNALSMLIRRVSIFYSFIIIVIVSEWGVVGLNSFTCSGRCTNSEGSCHWTFKRCRCCCWSCSFRGDSFTFQAFCSS